MSDNGWKKNRKMINEECNKKTKWNDSHSQQTHKLNNDYQNNKILDVIK